MGSIETLLACVRLGQFSRSKKGPGVLASPGCRLPPKAHRFASRVLRSVRLVAVLPLPCLVVPRLRVVCGLLHAPFAVAWRATGAWAVGGPRQRALLLVPGCSRPLPIAMRAARISPQTARGSTPSNITPTFPALRPPLLRAPASPNTLPHRARQRRGHVHAVCPLPCPCSAPLLGRLWAQVLGPCALGHAVRCEIMGSQQGGGQR